MPSLTATIRAEITSRGLSARQLSLATGVPQERISAMLRGGDMRGDNLGKLCDELGLELRPRRSAKRSHATPKARTEKRSPY